MATTITFEVIQFDAVRMIGKEVIVGKVNPVPKLVKTMLNDGSFDFLENMPERISPRHDTIGWMGDYNAETREFTYITGIFTKPGTTVPQGYSYRDIPACLMGIGWIQGEANLERGAHNRTVKIMKEQGYEYDDSAGGFTIEYYSYEKYISPEERGESVLTFGYYAPCKKIQL